VKSITTLIKRLHKACAIPDTDCKNFLIHYHEILPFQLCIANTESKGVDNEVVLTHASSVMDIEPALTQASSEMSINQFISISDDEDDNTKEEKIIRDP